MTDPIQQAAEQLRQAQQVTVLTGAGVSKESGVPTFRDALDGLWARYDPQQLATVAAFQRDPKLVWEWYAYRRGMVQQAQPNPGHHALAALERHFPALTIITQNVDDLHERAGSHDVIHLHGNIAQSKCFDDCQGRPTLIDLTTLADQTASPPKCPHCGAFVRPDVVWFGETLPVDALNLAATLSQQVDVMLVVGTSGLVTPAATLPEVAHRAGAVIIEVNPDDTPLSPLAHIKLSGPSGAMLPRLLEALNADA